MSCTLVCKGWSFGCEKGVFFGGGESVSECLSEGVEKVVQVCGELRWKRGRGHHNV